MKGYVYKIVNDRDDNVYVGSTGCSLRMRMKGHRADARKGKQSWLYIFMRLYGIEHFKIEEIECIDFEDRQELFDLEIYYINQYEDSYNTEHYANAQPSICMIVRRKIKKQKQNEKQHKKLVKERAKMAKRTESRLVRGCNNADVVLAYLGEWLERERLTNNLPVF